MLRALSLLLHVLSSPVFWSQSIKRLRFFLHDNVLAIPKLAELGRGSTVSPSAVFAFPENIRIGQNCLINHNNRLYAGANSKILIANGVMIGPDVFMTSDSFSKSMTESSESHSGKTGDIVIGENVRIGAHSILLPGVTIGENTAIGAGSVVTKDIPANVIAAGNPAVVVKDHD